MGLAAIPIAAVIGGAVLGGFLNGGNNQPQTPALPPVPPAAAPATMADPSVAQSTVTARNRAEAGAIMDGQSGAPGSLEAKPSTAQATLLGGGQ